MLLYTRKMPVKVKKKRSKAGCNYCKIKKKKCDEARPVCSRCLEHDEVCQYETAQPRKRRRRPHAFANPPLPPNHSATSEEGVSPEEQLSVSSSPEIQSSCGQWSDGKEGIPTRSLEMENVHEFDTITIHDSFIPEDTEKSIVGPSRPPTNLLLPATRSTTSPLLELFSPEFSEFSQDLSQRHLLHHFCNTFSHLIVLREDEGNPFQELILPLASHNLAVRNALCALSSAHLESKGVTQPDSRADSVSYHNEAICSLATLVEGTACVSTNELLATIILLVYYEVLVQKQRYNLVEGHLKGALAVLRDSPRRDDRTEIFLRNAFYFYDVIAALSFGTAPVSEVPKHSGCAGFDTSIPPGQHSHRTSIDALLGFATTLWPIIHRLSALLPLKRQIDEKENSGNFGDAATLRAEFSGQCSAVEVALYGWQPILPLELTLYSNQEGISKAKSARLKQLQSILNTALAYRHSALVYLHRTIYGHSRDREVVQHHSHTSLLHCDATVRYAGPMGALLWPLFVAACEATSPEDRALAKDVFTGYGKRQNMTNIERSWCIVQEVWRRTDAADDAESASTDRNQSLWRKVCEDMGVTLVFG